MSNSPFVAHRQRSTGNYVIDSLRDSFSCRYAYTPFLTRVFFIEAQMLRPGLDSLSTCNASLTVTNNAILISFGHQQAGVEDPACWIYFLLLICCSFGGGNPTIKFGLVVFDPRIRMTLGDFPPALTTFLHQ